MRRLRPRFIPVYGLFLAAALACSLQPAGAATLRESFDRTYPLAAGGSVQLKNTNGAVVVDAWDREEVRVEASKEVRSRSDEEARRVMSQLQIVVTPGAGSLRIETKTPENRDRGLLAWLFDGNVQGKVEYRLHVPRRLGLEARTVNGGVTLTGTRGKTQLETTNGSLIVASVDGPLVLETTNGNIEVRQSAGEVRAETTNGSVEVELTRVDGRLALESTNGGLTVRLPRDVRANVDADTTNGSVRTDLPVTTTTMSRRRLRGAINGGGPELRMSTTNGGIHILTL